MCAAGRPRSTSATRGFAFAYPATSPSSAAITPGRRRARRAAPACAGACARPCGGRAARRFTSSLPSTSSSVRSARPASSSQWCVATSTAPPPSATSRAISPDALALRRVEGRGRLVEEQHLRRREQRERDVEPLPVADRERRRRACPAGSSNSRRELVARGRAGLLRARRRAEVLERRQPPVVRRALRHPADALRTLDRAFARLERAREDREERRLAGAVRADERDHLAGGELDVRRLERHARPEAARNRRARAEAASPALDEGLDRHDLGGLVPSPRLEPDPVGEELPHRAADGEQRQRDERARQAVELVARARARRSRAAGAAAARCPSRSARRCGPRSGGCRGRAARPRAPRSGARRARR